MTLTTILSSASSWVGTAGIMGILAFAARAWFLNRKMDMAEKVEDRQGYGVLIEALQTQVKAMQDEVAKVRMDLAACQNEHLKSREEVIWLRAEVKGLQAQLIAHSQTVAVALSASAAVQDAGRRAADISGEV